MSEASSPCFFSRGVTMACRCDTVTAYVLLLAYSAEMRWSIAKSRHVLFWQLLHRSCYWFWMGTNLCRSEPDSNLMKDWLPIYPLLAIRPVDLNTDEAHITGTKQWSHHAAPIKCCELFVLFLLGLLIFSANLPFGDKSGFILSYLWQLSWVIFVLQ